MDFPARMSMLFQINKHTSLTEMEGKGAKRFRKFNRCLFPKNCMLANFSQKRDSL